MQRHVPMLNRPIVALAVMVSAIAWSAGAVLSAGGAMIDRQPTLSDIVACNEHADAKTAPSTLAWAVGEKTDPSGAIITESPDPLVQGMDAGRAGDSAYRAAYRQCMERRVESGR